MRTAEKRAPVSLLAIYFMTACLRHLAPIALLAFLASCLPLAPDDGDAVTALNPPDGMPLLSGYVKGSEITLGADTGAGAAVMLFPETVEACGGRIRGSGAVRETNLDVSLSPHGKPLPDSRFVVMLEEAPFANCDGLLGWPALRRLVWNINLPAGKHQFERSLPMGIVTWKRLAIDPQADILTLLMPGVGRVTLDTGSPLAVCLSPQKWADFKKEHPHIRPTVYWGYSPASGGYYARECAYLASYCLGPWEMQNVLVGENFVTEKAWGGPVPDYVLGMGALDRRSVWIDGPQGRLYYSRPHGEAPRLLGLNQVGVTFIPQNGQYVAFVAQGSPAEQSGVKTGDVLVAIDGKRPDGMMAVDHATTQPGVRVELCLRRRGQLNLVRWTLGEGLAPAPLQAPDGGNAGDPDAAAPHDTGLRREVSESNPTSAVSASGAPAPAVRL